jgi:hypothetical protein
MDNLDEYLINFQDYRDGNYEYETTTSLDDIQNAIIIIIEKKECLKYPHLKGNKDGN